MMDETILANNGALDQLMAKFKNHLRLTSDDADADLRDKLLSALTSVGHDIHRVLPMSTVKATAIVDSVGGRIVLKLRGPVCSVASVSVNGNAIREGEDYKVIGNTLQISGDYKEATVEVQYQAGYETIPADMWEAVCLRGAGAYSNPLDTVQERQRASDALIRPYRFKNWIS